MVQNVGKVVFIFFTLLLYNYFYSVKVTDYLCLYALYNALNAFMFMHSTLFII